MVYKSFKTTSARGLGLSSAKIIAFTYCASGVCVCLYDHARVVKPVYTRDLKSLGGNPVRVRIPPRAFP